MSTPPFPSLTKVWHTKPYPAILPSRPELSAKGKTVAITGGGTGIGAGIAKAFAAAGSTQIAIMSRTEKNLISTKKALETEFPEAKVLIVVMDITDKTQVDEGFTKIEQAFGRIDVFVSNAGYLPAPKAISSPDFDVKDWWAALCTNVLGMLYSVQAFVRHAAKGASLVHISTGISHIPPWESGVSGYAASKAAANKVMEYLAKENPEIHVVNVQPGVVESAMARKSGHQGLDDVALPGSFCVWLVSPEAKFLRGKFVWANWDVDEMKARREDILTTDLLDIKLGAISFTDWGGIHD